MKKGVFLLAMLFLLCGTARASVPEAWRGSIPSEAAALSEKDGSLLENGMAGLAERIGDAAKDAVRKTARSCVSLLLAVLLCGVLESAGKGAGKLLAPYVPLAGVACILTLSLGDLRALIGLGTETMEELHALGKLLLPTVAASIAAGGFAGTASAWQVSTLFATEKLTALITGILLPMTYSYIGLSAAGTILPESRLHVLAGTLKKLIGAALKGILILFTAFLSVSNVLTGAADQTAVKAAKAVSGVVPVVGSLLSDTAEAILSGASALRGTIGLLGIFSVLFLALAPLVRLGVQYVLYQAAAALSGLSGSETLGKFLEDLGGAFGLIFAMTASCALLLLAALIVAVTMVSG